MVRMFISSNNFFLTHLQTCALLDVPFITLYRFKHKRFSSWLHNFSSTRNNDCTIHLFETKRLIIYFCMLYTFDDLQDHRHFIITTHIWMGNHKILSLNGSWQIQFTVWNASPWPLLFLSAIDGTTIHLVLKTKELRYWMGCRTNISSQYNV